ncbi:hypothetical protein COOONC_02305 [Cooperia oncophora]
MLLRDCDLDSFSRLDSSDQQEDFECYKLVDKDDHDLLISYMLTDGLPVRYPDYHCGLEDYLDSFSAEISESDLAALNKMMTSLKDRHSLAAEQLLRNYKLVPSTSKDPCFRLVSFPAT